jgi:hypothetical protein
MEIDDDSGRQPGQKMRGGAERERAPLREIERERDNTYVILFLKKNDFSEK